MRNKHNSIHDSVFSMDYKIPYSKDSIESHLEQSQEEISFIKVKLTQAYQKLQFEIQNNNTLEEENQSLRQKMSQIDEKYIYEKKENCKLKETLEVILKNRKIMQEEYEETKESFQKKLSEKDRIIEQLNKEVKKQTEKCHLLTDQISQKDRKMKESQIMVRQYRMEREMENEKQLALANKIQILEQEITKLTEQKYIEVNRLRHELQLYQKGTNSFTREVKNEQQKIIERKRDFSHRNGSTKVHSKAFNSKNSEQIDLDFNKQNLNSLQMNSLEESSISKWKRSNQKDTPKSQNLQENYTPILTDDQKLTQYQIARKKADHELSALENLKRLGPDERQKIARLERQIYHLDSDIVGLKRKIRSKY